MPAGWRVSKPMFRGPSISSSSGNLTVFVLRELTDSQFPDDEDGDVPWNVGLLAIQSPDAASWEYFVENMLFIRVARYIMWRVPFACRIVQVLDSIFHVIFLTEHRIQEISTVSFLKCEGGEVPVPRTCCVQKTRWSNMPGH